jgi:hypothetical protein
MSKLSSKVMVISPTKDGPGESRFAMKNGGPRKGSLTNKNQNTNTLMAKSAEGAKDIKDKSREYLGSGSESSPKNIPKIDVTKPKDTKLAFDDSRHGWAGKKSRFSAITPKAKPQQHLGDNEKLGNISERPEDSISSGVLSPLMLVSSKLNTKSFAQATNQAQSQAKNQGSTHSLSGTPRKHDPVSKGRASRKGSEIKKNYRAALTTNFTKNLPKLQILDLEVSSRGIMSEHSPIPSPGGGPRRSLRGSMKKSIKPELTTKTPKENNGNDDASTMFLKATFGSEKPVKKVGFGSQRSLKKVGGSPVQGSDGSASGNLEKAFSEDGKAGG